MRYTRGLSTEALTLWVEREVPRLLLQPILTCIAGDPCALDIQLREGGVLQVYHGNTSLLRIQVSECGHKLQLRFDSYESHASASMPGFRREWALDEIVVLSRGLRELLPAVADRTGSSYYRNRREGYWENQICYTYGRSWNPGKAWLVLDRQAVLGFGSGADKKNFFEPILRKYAFARQSLVESQDRKWQAPKPVGDELDLLAVNRDREIVCIELKHASNGGGVYDGPFQAAVYRDAYLLAANAIATGTQELVSQKIALGLLPPASASLLPISQPAVVRGILAVVGATTPEVRRRLELSLQRCGDVEYCQLPDSESH